MRRFYGEHSGFAPLARTGQGAALGGRIEHGGLPGVRLEGELAPREVTHGNLL
jgi:hypothetical protein